MCMRAFMFCSRHKCLYLCTVEKLSDTRRLKCSYFPSSPSSCSSPTLESVTKIEKIYSALASVKFLKLKNCKEYLESAHSNPEEDEEEEEAKERNNAPAFPSLLLDHSSPASGLHKRDFADRSTDKRTFHNAKLCRGRLNFPASYIQKCLLIVASSSPRDMTQLHHTGRTAR